MTTTNITINHTAHAVHKSIRKQCTEKNCLKTQHTHLKTESVASLLRLFVLYFDCTMMSFIGYANLAWGMESSLVINGKKNKQNKSTSINFRKYRNSCPSFCSIHLIFLRFRFYDNEYHSYCFVLLSALNFKPYTFRFYLFPYEIVWWFVSIDFFCFHVSNAIWVFSFQMLFCFAWWNRIDSLELTD